MDNIFTLQFPESRFDADAVLDALKGKTILTAKEWDVWPFLANVNPIEDEDDYEEGEGFSSQDRIMLGFMRQELLHQIDSKSKNGEYEAIAQKLIKELDYPVTKKTTSVVVKSLTAFRMIFSLCIAASYARVFFPTEAGMDSFMRVWKREVELACNMDSAYRKAYGTQGLICKNPRELMTLFIKVTLAELLSTNEEGKRASLSKTAKKVSGGVITEEILTSWEGVLKDEMKPVITTVTGYFSDE